MKVKEEDAIKDRFIEFLKRDQGIDYAVVDRDVKSTTGLKDFDYLLNSNGQTLALEVTRLFESETGVKESNHWTLVINELKGEIQTQTQNMNFTGGYRVHSPYTFEVTKYKVRQLAPTVARLIIDAAQGIKNIGEDQEIQTPFGWFEVKRISDTPSLFFSSSSQPRWLGRYDDQVDSLIANLSRLLGEKNSQLNTEANRKILLIEKRNPHVDEEVIIGALAHIELSQISNIDEIYVEFGEGDFIKVYDKNIHSILRNQRISNEQRYVLPLFSKWLLDICDLYPDDIYYLLYNQRQIEPTYNTFPNGEARSSLVRIGEIFLRKKEYDKVKWIVDNFVDDPDPSMEHPYHEAISRGDKFGGERPTVRYEVAWLIKELVLNPDTLGYAFEKMKRFIETENLFVIWTAFFFLPELVDCRDKLPPNQKAEFHDVLISLICRFSKYTIIKKQLANLFRGYPIPASDMPTVRVLFE